MKSIFPLYIVEDLAAAKRFYCSIFRLTVRFEAEWYLHLVGPNPAIQLAFIRPGHETVPKKFRDQRAVGSCVSIEIDDAAGYEKRAREANVEIIYPLTDERWGQRHFMTLDPNGLVVDVIEPIPPDQAWFREQAKR